MPVGKDFYTRNPNITSAFASGRNRALATLNKEEPRLTARGSIDALGLGLREEHCLKLSSPRPAGLQPAVIDGTTARQKQHGNNGHSIG
ncbi:hypothetical protein DYST_01895 [Dyella terrae]|nr:hypothetical protein DYST_01895 [Dyella terrae]